MVVMMLCHLCHQQYQHFGNIFEKRSGNVCQKQWKWKLCQQDQHDK